MPKTPAKEKMSRAKVSAKMKAAIAKADRFIPSKAAQDKFRKQNGGLK